MRLRDRLVDNPRSVGARMRTRRWDMFQEEFPDIAEYNVLDLGGTAEYWRRAPVKPQHVTVVNLLEPGEPGDRIDTVTGDACEYKALDQFDLVVSNSLLEHVGGHAPRARLARVIRSSAPRHWVQTPYRYFPVEPHWLFPGMQFLPVSVKARIGLSWPLQHTRSPNHSEAVDSVLWTELIGKTEMTALFPESRVRFEFMLGLPKSLLAVRTR